MNPAVETVRLVGGLYDGIELIAQVGCSQVFLNHDPDPHPATLRFALYQREGSSNVFRSTPLISGVVVGMPAFYKPPLGIPFHWSHDASGVMHSTIEQFMANQVGCGPAPSAENLQVLVKWATHYINAPCWDRAVADAFEDELANLRARIGQVKNCDEFYSWACDCRDIGLDPL